MATQRAQHIKFNQVSRTFKDQVAFHCPWSIHSLARIHYACEKQASFNPPYKNSSGQRSFCCVTTKLNQFDEAGVRIACDLWCMCNLGIQKWITRLASNVMLVSWHSHSADVFSALLPPTLSSSSRDNTPLDAIGPQVTPGAASAPTLAPPAGEALAEAGRKRKWVQNALTCHSTTHCTHSGAVWK